MYLNTLLSILIGMAISLALDLRHLSEKINQLDKHIHTLELKYE